jgi:hypothetical protein
MELQRTQEKQKSPEIIQSLIRGKYWVRTSDPYLVEVVL